MPDEDEKKKRELYQLLESGVESEPDYRDRGINPLAEWLFREHNADYDPEVAQGTYLDPRFPQRNPRRDYAAWPSSVPTWDRKVRSNTSIDDAESDFRAWHRENEDAARRDSRDQSYALLRKYIGEKK